MKPPRTMAVPFELGRPLGSPGDAAFQTRVLNAALDLLDDPAPGPVYTEFDEDAPDAAPAEDEAWACPVNFAGAMPDGDLVAQVKQETDLLAPWYGLAVRERGHTTTGASGLSLEDNIDFLAAFLSDTPPTASPNEALSLGDCYKLAIEDMKAYYNEAIAAQPGVATAEDAANWFWGETRAGELLLAIRKAAEHHEDGLVKAVTMFTMVPGAQSHRLKSG